MRQKKVLLPQSADFIFHEKVRRFWFFQKDRSLGHLSFDSLNPSSLFILRVAVFCALFISLARLFMLTVVNGEKYRSLAEENRVRLVTIEAARGKSEFPIAFDSLIIKSIPGAFPGFVKVVE